ncbi:hypothetical protein J4H92_13495 [Leucobacter weissii]|uniref:Uncharacterized protein n=1 Tax=Leucobacter weissii TaxID=1983706 RepID=A0A939MQ94_9MICO|nr:hypothetical protein [Leucobacter weissii]MBO1902957.1 hypothetical protein [Leucobacter weissii]
MASSPTSVLSLSLAGMLLAATTAGCTSTPADEPAESPAAELARTEFGGLALLERDGHRLLTEAEEPQAVMQALHWGVLATNDAGCFGLEEDGKFVGIAFPHGSEPEDGAITWQGERFVLGDELAIGGGWGRSESDSPTRDAFDACEFSSEGEVFFGQGEMSRGEEWRAERR